MAVPGYTVTIRKDALMVLLERTAGPFTNTGPVAEAMGEVVRDWGAIVQARAVRNVSGYPVVYDGGAFRVMVRTGTLKGSIELQWPYQQRLQARIFVNGTAMSPGQLGRRPTPVSAYAFRIEFGGPEIDLKKSMQGKIVPFFGVRDAKSTGPYAARGLVPVRRDDEAYGSRWQSEALNVKLAAKGKGPMIFVKKGGNAAYQGAKRGASTYFISFRRVGKTGWIIPAARPRPFMRAAIQGTAPQARRMAVRKLTTAMGLRR